MQRKNLHIIDHLLEHALTNPEGEAFIILDAESIEQKVTYRELAGRVRELSSFLSTYQARGKRVLLVYQDIMQFIVSFLAVQYAGIIPVPVSFAKGTRQVERLTSIIADAEAAAVLCSQHSAGRIERGLENLLKEKKIEIIITDTGVPVDNLVNAAPLFNDIAFIQYTSGSTGRPKGVVITAANLMHNQHLLKNAFGCNKHSVIFSWLPFHHDMGLIGNILHAVYTGCTCIIMSPFHFMQRPQRWLEAISRYKVTHSGGPNFAYDLCVNKFTADELSGLDLSHWKVAYNGSEPVRLETMERFSSYFENCGFNKRSFFPCYGLAEATLLVAGNKYNEAPAALLTDKVSGRRSRTFLTEKPDVNTELLVSSGSVAPGMDVKIFSQNMLECGDLEEGEICIAGESVTEGYWNKDNSTVFYVFAGKRYLRTGDLGCLCQGELFVHGRLKEMLIIRGRNFYPYDIEQAVSECHPAIEANGVAAFSLRSSEDEFVIVAEIKRALLKRIDPKAVLIEIEKAVVGSMGVRPFDILLIAPFGIPRTTSGKLQRVKCRSLYERSAFPKIASMLNLPKTSVKQADNDRLLQKLFDDSSHDSVLNYLVFKIESYLGEMPERLLAKETELTEMGVDSLRAMQLVNAINKDLNINLDAAKIFQENSLSALVTIIENMLWLKSRQPIGKELMI